MARRSIRDRNAAAIAPMPAAAEPDAETQPATPTLEPPREPSTTAPDRAATASTSDISRLGVYLTPADFNDAKAGYLVEWQHGGDCDTFARWISTVIENHADRTVAERAQLARPIGRAETRTGSSRTFNVSSSSLARMREAMNADQASGHFRSDSAWAVDAIVAAVRIARTKAGGELPEPPARLPNRLRR